MDLLEYQAKNLFQQVGIPVLPSQQLHNLQDLKQLEIPYPIVLKSQVRSGRRAEAGGIRFVENTIDAIAAAQALFKLPIAGQLPAVLLAETRYRPDREFYLAIALDSSVCRPVLLGSALGGVGIDLVLDQIQRVVVEREFTPFYARQLALKMGLSGVVLQRVSQIIEKMCTLFVQKDLDLIEINPLGIDTNGDVMALDGKISVNDYALARHADLVQLPPNAAERRPLEKSALTGRSLSLPSLEPLELNGNIGILCNGAGLTMMTLDMVCQAGGKPASVVNVGSDCNYAYSPRTLLERVEFGLQRLSQIDEIEVILVNLLGGGLLCSQIAAVISRYARYNALRPLPRLVIRITGDELKHARELLAEFKIPVVDQLDAAISHTVASSQPEHARSSA
jgi:succinyl-CoA synthetase beta subunit